MTHKLKIPFAKVICDGNELDYVREVIESGWLTTAGKCFEFERRIAEAVGARYACAVNSCTAALHMAAEAVGIGPGDRVFVPTMTFTATAEVLRYLGADPVLVDMEYGSCLVTPEILDAAATCHPGVKAAMIVHFGGQCAQMLPVAGAQGVRPGILDVCRRHGLRVIEDAAHAFPSRLNGRMVGSFGDATCFSFYANKTITTGEGGMLVTDNAELAKRARLMRLHGIDRDVWNRFTSEKPSWEYDVVAPGFKYNMPDINAAIGLAQLERSEELRVGRQKCAEFYFSNLAGVPGLDLPAIRAPFADHAWHLFWIVLNEAAPVSRQAFIEAMSAAGIGTSVHYKPLHRMTYYREQYQLDPKTFPNAERHWRGCVSLPIYAGLSEGDLAYVCQTVRQILRVQ